MKSITARAGTGHSVLPSDNELVTQFLQMKERISELESINSKLRTENEFLYGMIDTIQNENVKLSEAATDMQE